MLQIMFRLTALPTLLLTIGLGIPGPTGRIIG
jgi:hypothetical protein